jgi:hypothetical protein
MTSLVLVVDRAPKKANAAARAEGLWSRQVDSPTIALVLQHITDNQPQASDDQDHADE